MSELNDPRVLFAAERTLMAWARTSITVMAFGFAIERFGLFVRMLGMDKTFTGSLRISFWLGLTFVITGLSCQLFATMQYRQVLKTLKPVEIPKGYRTGFVSAFSYGIALLGMLLAVYLTLSSI